MTDDFEIEHNDKVVVGQDAHQKFSCFWYVVFTLVGAAIVLLVSILIER